MKPRSLLLTALLVGALSQGCGGRPSIEPWYQEDRVTIVNLFLGEYQLGMNYAAIRDPKAGAVIAEAICEAGQSFDRLDIVLFTPVVEVHGSNECTVTPMSSPGFRFLPSTEVMIEVSGNNGSGGFTKATKLISLSPPVDPVAPTN